MAPEILVVPDLLGLLFAWVLQRVIISWRTALCCSSLISSLPGTRPSSGSILNVSFSTQQSKLSIPFAREQNTDFARKIGVSSKGLITLRCTDTSHGCPGDVGDAAALRKMNVVLSWIVLVTPAVMSSGIHFVNASLLYLMTFPQEMTGRTSRIETTPLPSNTASLLSPALAISLGPTALTVVRSLMLSGVNSSLVTSMLRTELVGPSEK